MARDEKAGEGYAVIYEGEEVGRVGSIAGIFSAIGASKEVTDRTVSIAYVGHGKDWFLAWAQSRDVRTIEIHDFRRQAHFRLVSAQLSDASQCGVVFEARVKSAHEVEFGSPAIRRRRD